LQRRGKNALRVQFDALKAATPKSDKGHATEIERILDQIGTGLRS